MRPGGVIQVMVQKCLLGNDGSIISMYSCMCAYITLCSLASSQKLSVSKKSGLFCVCLFWESIQLQ